MAQTLQNQLLLAKSMNSIIRFDDGAGTVIENGTIDTDLLEVEQLNATNFTTNAMIANSLQLLRTSTTAVNNLLGTVIDVGPILNNVKFDTVARQIQIWNDTATSQLMTIDVDNNSIGTQGSFSTQALTTNSLISNTSITTDTFLQNLGLGGGTSYNWNFGDRNIIYLSPASPYTFNLPLVPSSSYHGTNVYIFMLNSSGITITTPFGPPSKSFVDETNALVQTKTYSSNIRYFQFTAFGSASAFIHWRLTNIQSITRDYADSIYGRLASSNTWTSTNAFNSLTLTRNGTPAVNALLGSTIDVGAILNNVKFDTAQRYINVFADNAYGIITIDVSNSGIAMQPNNLSIFPTIALDFNCPAITFTSSTVSFPNTTVSFNTNLPTSTVTPNADNQLITRIYADGRYGELGTANIFTAQNEFRNGILPCRGSTVNAQTDIQLGGANQFQYRQAASQYNIGIGALTIVGDSAGLANNVGKRNIGIGHQALNTGDNINDCIAIGYQAMQNCGSIRVYTVACQRQIAIGSGAMQNGIYSTDSIAIGTNALKNCTSGNGNIVIAHNGGVAQIQGNAVIIGSQSAPTISDNGFVCVGYRTAFNATGQANRCVFIGEQAGLNNNNGASNTHIGGLAGQNNITGNQLTCIGTFAGGNGSINNATNSTAIGCNAQYLESYECVIGGDSTLADTITFPRLTLPNKNRINCCQFTGDVATYTINFRTNEYVVVNSATCTQINLPQAIFTNQNRVGAAFHICRTHLSTSDLTITAFGTEKINWKGALYSSVTINSWVMSISFVCVGNVAGNGVWSVFTYNDRVTLANDANKIQTLPDSTNVNYPVCFTTESVGGNYNYALCNSSLNYNPSTSLLTVPNVVLPNKLRLQSSTVYNTASVTLSIGSTLNDNIILQSNTVTQIYLPSSYTDANIGCSFTITRAYTPIITDVINIDTTGGAQFVSADFAIGPTEWFMDYSITTVRLTLTKISTLYTWVLSYTRRIAILADTTSNFNYPVLFAPLEDNAQEIFADSTNINYNPSTDTLNVNNISTTKPILEKQENIVEVTTTTNVNVDPQAGQYSLYKFCNMGVGIVTYRLPTISTSTVGWRFMVKRMYGSNSNVCTFNPSAFTTQPIIFDTNAAPSTASYNMSAIQSMFEFVTAITQHGGISGLFSNAAASTTITITHYSGGNILFLGGKVDFNGNIRTIVAYGTGRGRGGTYIVDTAITAANTTQPFTSIESYGYILTNFN